MPPVRPYPRRYTCGTLDVMTKVQVMVMSFGYLHGPPPKSDITVDVREYLRDPHTDHALRVLTGNDSPVWRKVTSTPGALDLISALTDIILALLPNADRSGKLVTLAIGCAGGRHRSVVIADAVADRVTVQGVGVEVDHRDIDKDVVVR